MRRTNYIQVSPFRADIEIVDIFVARQAIFDRDLKVHGYELLHRTGNSEAGGANQILGSGFGFVNCPQSLLTDERLALLPPAKTVIEILETVKPEPAVISACRRLKDRGFTLALDDFAGQPGYEPLIDLADIIKVEFPALNVGERAAICRKYRDRGIRMLAEKVETRREFRQALDMGYDFYQGYFFARPVTLQGREIQGHKATYVALLKEIQKPEIDRFRVRDLLRTDASLTHRLLRYINSAAFGLRIKINSVQLAMGQLGDNGIRQWLWLAAIPNFAADKPQELMTTAAIRGKFCELVAPLAQLHGRMSDLFLMGMFSFLDAMLDRPLQELVGELFLPEDVKDALLGAASPGNRMAIVLDLVQAYEMGDWYALADCADRLRVPEERLPKLYLQAITWADHVFSGDRKEKQPLQGALC